MTGNCIDYFRIIHSIKPPDQTRACDGMEKGILTAVLKKESWNVIRFKAVT